MCCEGCALPAAAAGRFGSRSGDARPTACVTASDFAIRRSRGPVRFRICMLCMRTLPDASRITVRRAIQRGFKHSVAAAVGQSMLDGKESKAEHQSRRQTYALYSFTVTVSPTCTTDTATAAGKTQTPHTRSCCRGRKNTPTPPARVAHRPPWRDEFASSRHITDREARPPRDALPFPPRSGRIRCRQRLWSRTPSAFAQPRTAPPCRWLCSHQPRATTSTGARRPRRASEAYHRSSWQRHLPFAG